MYLHDVLGHTEHLLDGSGNNVMLVSVVKRTENISASKDGVPRSGLRYLCQMFGEYVLVTHALVDTQVLSSSVFMYCKVSIIYSL